MFKISEEEITNAHTYFRKLESVYFLFIALPLGLFVYTYFLTNRPGHIPPEPVAIPDFINWSIIMIPLIALFLIYKNFQNKLKSISETVEGVRPKMVAYFNANVWFYGLMEVVALLWALVYWQTHQGVFELLFGLHVAYISTQRNTPKRLGQHLKFSKELYDKIRKGEEL